MSALSPRSSEVAGPSVTADRRPAPNARSGPPPSRKAGGPDIRTVSGHFPTRMQAQYHGAARAARGSSKIPSPSSRIASCKRPSWTRPGRQDRSRPWARPRVRCRDAQTLLSGAAHGDGSPTWSALRLAGDRTGLAASRRAHRDSRASITNGSGLRAALEVKAAIASEPKSSECRRLDEERHTRSRAPGKRRACGIHRAGT